MSEMIERVNELSESVIKWVKCVNDVSEIMTKWVEEWKWMKWMREISE